MITTNYTPKEVAERLDITRVEVYHLIEQGRLAAINVGSGCKKPRWIIKEDDFLNFESRYTKWEGRGGNTRKKHKAVKKESLLIKEEMDSIMNAFLDLGIRLEDLKKMINEMEAGG